LNVEQIFQSLQKGKISPSRAEKLLSLYSIEKIGNIAQIDTGRRNRKGIPEIIFAERKHLLDLKKIIKKTLSKNNEVLVSRIKQKDYAKILEFSKKNKYKIKKGKNTNIQNLTNGPGKLTQAMQISISQYNTDLTKKSAVFITEGIKPKKIFKKSRVGITKGIDKLWNFSFNI